MTEKSPIDYALMPLERYAEFDGRSSRMEYWMFALMNSIIFIVLFMLMSLGGDGIFLIIAIGMGIYGLAVIIPSIAVQVRRFHDQDLSGWFVLIGLIPYIGGLIVFVFMCLNGTNGHNQYGPDPKA